LVIGVGKNKLTVILSLAATGMGKLFAFTATDATIKKSVMKNVDLVFIVVGLI